MCGQICQSVTYCYSRGKSTAGCTRTGRREGTRAKGRDEMPYGDTVACNRKRKTSTLVWKIACNTQDPLRTLNRIRHAPCYQLSIFIFIFFGCRHICQGSAGQVSKLAGLKSLPVLSPGDVVLVAMWWNDDAGNPAVPARVMSLSTSWLLRVIT